MLFVKILLILILFTTFATFASALILPQSYNDPNCYLRCYDYKCYVAISYEMQCVCYDCH